MFGFLRIFFFQLSEIYEKYAEKTAGEGNCKKI